MKKAYGVKIEGYLLQVKRPGKAPALCDQQRKWGSSPRRRTTGAIKSLRFEGRGDESWWKTASKAECAEDMQVEASMGEIVQGLYLEQGVWVLSRAPQEATERLEADANASGLCCKDCSGCWVQSRQERQDAKLDAFAPERGFLLLAVTVLQVCVANKSVFHLGS